MGASAVQQREPLEVWRCPKCGRILAKLRMAPGMLVQVKCHACNNLAEKG